MNKRNCQRIAKAIPIGNYVSGPLPTSFFEECEISEIHGENARMSI